MLRTAPSSLNSTQPTPTPQSKLVFPEPTIPEHCLATDQAKQKLEAVLNFEAPHLIAKLVDDGVASAVQGAEQLFTEVKKYLWLTLRTQPALPMYSARVDAVWHSFLQFSADYQRFCSTFLGAFCHHKPEVSGSIEHQTAQSVSVSREAFIRLYEEHFGALPRVWNDWEDLQSETRLRRTNKFSPMAVVINGDVATLRGGIPAQLICRTPPVATDALRFVADHACFLIRELPGLKPTARLGLVRPLVRYGVLHLAV